jgi:hypothetical protein
MDARVAAASGNVGGQFFLSGLALGCAKWLAVAAA